MIYVFLRGRYTSFSDFIITSFLTHRNFDHSLYTLFVRMIIENMRKSWTTHDVCADTGELNPNPLFAGALSPVSYMPHRFHPRSNPHPCNGLGHRLYKKRRLPLHHRLNGGPDRSCTYDAPLGVRFYRPMRPTDIRLVPKNGGPCG